MDETIQFSNGKENANSASFQLQSFPADHNIPENKNVQICTTPQPPFDLNLKLYNKIIEELENWKAYQEEKFLIQLKEKETQHLKNLTEAYCEFKAKKERELTAKMNQFSSLFKSIELVFADLKRSVPDHTKCNEMFISLRRDMQQVMLDQLVSVKEKVHNLQKEHLDRLQSQALKEQQLQSHIALLRGENEQLKQQILHIERDQLTLRDSVKNCDHLLKTNQDLKNLNEELALKKTYYKEQWVRVIREIQKMKSRNTIHHTTIEEQSHSGLQQYVNSELNELYNEARELKSVKHWVT